MLTLVISYEYYVTKGPLNPQRTIGQEILFEALAVVLNAAILYAAYYISKRNSHKIQKDE